MFMPKSSARAALRAEESFLEQQQKVKRATSNMVLALTTTFMSMEVEAGTEMPDLVKIKTVENVRQEHPEHPGEEHFRYCPTCGVWLKKKQIVIRYVCSECRHFIPEGSQFCAFCGVKFTGASEEKWAFRRQLSDEEFDKAAKTIFAESGPLVPNSQR
ncbi:hypothetical protein ES708_32608 [subsurface metagenome]